MMKMTRFSMNVIIKFLPTLFWTTQIFLPCCLSTSGYKSIKFGAVSCNYSGISVDIFLEGNFDGIVYSKGFFFNPSCRYFPPSASVNQSISFFLPLNDCGNLIGELNGIKYISNTIVVQNHHIVETASDVVYNISCKLLKTEELWTRGNHSNHYRNDALESWMEFPLESNILGKDLTHKLLVGDKFLMAFHLKDGGAHKDLQVENCWAHDSETVDKSQYILHIYDRHACEPSTWVSEFNLTEGIKNISDSMTYSVIKAFKFPMTKNVHITCSVQICKISCVDNCKESESARPIAYHRILKRSTSENNIDKSLRERYQLMKNTVKVLGAKLVEARRSSDSDFRRRLADFESITTQDYEVLKTSQEYEYAIPSNNSQLKELANESEHFGNAAYVFNLTNNVVVNTGHEFNFRHGYVTVTNLSAKCVSKLRFEMVTATLGFISVSLLIFCIGLYLYLRKEKKKHKINNFLLYNFY